MVTAIGYAGSCSRPRGRLLEWAIVIGLGQGASFPLALTLIVLRSGSAGPTSGLSTHVQGGGYLLAAAGPLLVGALHQLTGSWSVSLVLLIAVLVPQALSGIGAGRERTLAATLAR